MQRQIYVDIEMKSESQVDRIIVVYIRLCCSVYIYAAQRKMSSTHIKTMNSNKMFIKTAEYMLCGYTQANVYDCGLYISRSAWKLLINAVDV